MKTLQSPSAHTLYMRGWRARNHDKNVAYLADYSKQYRRRLKLEAFTAYGGTTCACCGFDDDRFLCIDHVNGHGRKHRDEVGGGGSMLYRWLRDNQYPTGYQVLCHNCNQAKASFGACPHQEDVPLAVGRGK